MLLKSLGESPHFNYCFSFEYVI